MAFRIVKNDGIVNLKSDEEQGMALFLLAPPLSPTDLDCTSQLLSALAP